MIVWLWLACGAPPPSVSEGVPRSTDAAEARLGALGLTAPSCEGGALGDELSLVCTAHQGATPVVVEAVTTGLPLPPPPVGVGELVGDLWVTVHVEGDDVASRELLQRFAGR